MLKKTYVLEGFFLKLLIEILRRVQCTRRMKINER